MSHTTIATAAVSAVAHHIEMGVYFIISLTKPAWFTKRFLAPNACAIYYPGLYVLEGESPLSVVPTATLLALPAAYEDSIVLNWSGYNRIIST